jgi:hypothetical protein
LVHQDIIVDLSNTSFVFGFALAKPLPYELVKWQLMVNAIVVAIAMIFATTALVVIIAYESVQL